MTNQVTISAEGLRLTVRWNAWAGTVAVVTSIAASSIRWPLSARGGTLGRGSGAPGSAGSDGGRSRVAGTDIVSEESLTR